jgi:hypothetical protein
LGSEKSSSGSSHSHGHNHSHNHKSYSQHPLRALSGPVVLFWCLDPAFPGLPTLASLDVDGFMSNSHRALIELQRLSPHTPAAYVPLAADPKVVSGSDTGASSASSSNSYCSDGCGFGSVEETNDNAATTPAGATASAAATAAGADGGGGNGGGEGSFTSSSPPPPSPPPSLSAERSAVLSCVHQARGKLVYVGSAGGLESKAMLAPLLREAKNARLPAPPISPLHSLHSQSQSSQSPSSSSSSSSSSLVIFGSGWGGEEEWASCCWGGVLPHKDGALDEVYRASFAVLGATMDDQREYGMVREKKRERERVEITKMRRGHFSSSLSLFPTPHSFFWLRGKKKNQSVSTSDCEAHRKIVVM